MRPFVVYVLIAFFGVVIGHTTLVNVIVNGQTRTDCLRPTYDDSLYLKNNLGSTFPMSDEFRFPNGITGENYTCGWMPFAANPASAKCAIAAGSTITVTHRNDPEKDSIPYLAPNHRGPFMAYLSPWNQAGGVPLGKTWFKVYQSGIIEHNANPELIKWAAPDTLRENQGKISFQIPADLAPGNYLLRTEILSFLSSSRNGAQGYIRCAELTITGNGAAQPSGDYLAQLPGSITYNDPGIRGIWWSDYADDYPFPGPKPYVAGAITTVAPTPTQATTKPTQAPTQAPTTVPTSEGEVLPLEVLVTVTLQVAPSSLRIQAFSSDVTGVLAIPAAALTNVQVDLDASSDTTTVVRFTINNALKPDGDRVDPIAAAYKLRDMAARNDPQLAGTVYLANMKVNNVEEQQTEQPTNSFVGTQGFIIMIAVIAGVVLIAVTVGVTVIIVRKRRSSGFF